MAGALTSCQDVRSPCNRDRVHFHMLARRVCVLTYIYTGCSLMLSDFPKLDAPLSPSGRGFRLCFLPGNDDTLLRFPLFSYHLPSPQTTSSECSCLNGGTCDSEICVCPAGTFRRFCVMPLLTIGFLLAATGGSLCEFSFAVDPHYHGESVHRRAVTCGSMTCAHGASCSGTSMCVCSDGYGGETCGDFIGACSATPAPCMSAGSNCYGATTAVMSGRSTVDFSTFEANGLMCASSGLTTTEHTFYRLFDVCSASGNSGTAAVTITHIEFGVETFTVGSNPSLEITLSVNEYTPPATGSPTMSDIGQTLAMATVTLAELQAAITSQGNYVSFSLPQSVSRLCGEHVAIVFHIPDLQPTSGAFFLGQVAASDEVPALSSFLTTTACGITFASVTATLTKTLVLNARIDTTNPECSATLSRCNIDLYCTGQAFSVVAANASTATTMNRQKCSMVSGRPKFRSLLTRLF